MRILHILNHVQEIGNGIVNVAINLSCFQGKDGYEVAVASLGGEYETLLAEFGVQHFKLDQTRTPANLVKAFWGFRAIISEFQPDIVHAHMMTGVVIAKVFQPFYSYALVSTVHNEFQRSSILMGLADRAIAVSDAVASSLIKRGIPAHKLSVVKNGTLLSVRRRNVVDPVELKRPAILTVAGMYRRKGIAELIDAFKQIAPDFPDANLYLVGDGPDRELFEAQVGELNSRIHFERFQPEPQRYMLSADIFVLASHREPFGLVISEAREAGSAIIATNVDGIPEALNDGQAGILVPPQDSRTLAATLRELLSNPELISNWKQRSQQNLEQLSVMRVHKQTLSIYDRLIGGI